MNWHLETTGDKVARAKPVEVLRAEGEEAEPDAKLLAATRQAAKLIAAALGGEVHITAKGHETILGNGFKAGHVQLVVSRLDPDRPREATP